MIADSSPIDSFKGSLRAVGVKLGAFREFFGWSAQGLAVQRNAVGRMHETVKDGVRNGRIGDHLVPVIDGELTGHDRRGAAVAIVDDFEQVATLLRGQRRQPPIVEDQKLNTGEALEQAYIASIAARQRQGIEQAWYAMIEHRSIVTACLVAERAGQPTLAGAGFAGDQEVLSAGDPVTGREFGEQRLVETTRRLGVEILDGGVLPETRILEPGDELFVGSGEPMLVATALPPGPPSIPDPDRQRT